ncbi:Alpha/Beta hydrolase protein [Mycena vitilis]|nr:Alpha/Beta hydrolase protein [Mycena vitilis]
MALAFLHTVSLATLALCLSLATANSVTAPVVDLGYAQYQGVSDTELNITSFRGIRYAASPTGPLRWQAPAPPSKIGGVQQAVRDPAQCWQASSNGAAPTNPLNVRDVEETEDCLFLNVYSPVLNSTALLPTIVWIHGGGYIYGSASQYNGAELVQESNNEVVVVVIQYRLGLFGFLAGQQVKQGGALNVGLLDQDFALRWVNKNIHKFGGDPSAVTIWGESAGAGSVLQHVIANNGKTNPSLFRAAITSSAFLTPQYPHDSRVPQTIFNDVVTQAGCNGTNTLECLRAADGAMLGDINSNTIIAGFQGTPTFVPVIDGLFITQSPTDALLHGKVNGEVLLSVTNTNEGVIFVNQTAEYNVAEYAGNLFPLFGAKERNATASVYKLLGSPLDQVNLIMTEGSLFFRLFLGNELNQSSAIFICPTYLLLDAFPGKSYKGEYAIPPALHGQDLINYFPSLTAFNVTLIYNNTDFINAFSQGFVSFAVNLDPNDKLRPSIVPLWERWSLDAQPEMVFNRTEGGAPYIAMTNTSRAHMERCE